MFKYFLAFFSLFLLAGCAATPNPPLFMMYPADTGAIREQSAVATIIASYRTTIDGLSAIEERRLSSSGSVEESIWAYDVLPGEHKITLTYTPAQGRSESGGYVYVTSFASEKVSANYTFEAGKVYWATIRFGSPKIVFIEEGFPSRPDEYRKQSFSPETVIQNIQNSRTQSQ